MLLGFYGPLKRDPHEAILHNAAMGIGKQISFTSPCFQLVCEHIQ